MQPEKNAEAQNESVALLAKAIAEAGRKAAPNTPNRQQPMNGMENIDLMQILFALRAKIVYIILAALIFGTGTMFYTERYVTPLYQASIQMIVNARKDVYTSTTVSDVTSAENLVATYATVIKSNRVMERVVKSLELNMSWTSLNGMVDVRPVNDTPVINIVCTSADPEFCRKVVTSISEIAPELIVEAVEAGSCKVISDAYSSGYPISPNIRGNVEKGMLLGAALASAIVVLLHLLNDTIQSEEQLMELSDAPVLSTIPMLGSRSSRKHYGSSHKKRKHSSGRFQK